MPRFFSLLLRFYDAKTLFRLDGLKDLFPSVGRLGNVSWTNKESKLKATAQDV